MEKGARSLGATRDKASGHPAPRGQARLLPTAKTSTCTEGKKRVPSQAAPRTKGGRPRRQTRPQRAH
eukprot:9165308-Alexandrium_andersonii.AAC.1